MTMSHQSIDLKDNSVPLHEVDAIVAVHGRSPEAVIPILQEIQGRFCYLPSLALRRVCEITEITPAIIAGVATFYSQFRHEPAGRHRIKVCIGTACHVKGAEAIYQAFKDRLSIPDDEDTDQDRLFTVEKVACLGCCMLAPAVQIDDTTYGYLTPETVSNVLRDFLQEQKEQTAEEEASENMLPKMVGEVRICLCSSCVASGAHDLYLELKREIRKLGLAVRVKNVGCTGSSHRAPSIEIQTNKGGNYRYGRLQRHDVRRVLLRHFKPANHWQRITASFSEWLDRWVDEEAWEPVTRYLWDDRDNLQQCNGCSQQRLVTEHGGRFDPLDLDEYLGSKGFAGARRCLTQLSPDEVIKVIEDSGLRGRGGAGFPTYRKWKGVKEASGPWKYLVCNGDEGDPGAFMDRMILESFPFKVIEGMILASYAVGAAEGYLYIRAEYPLAAERMKKAIGLCEERGILGENIFGSGHALRLQVVLGAGAFVCGEETALLSAIEGKRGVPRLRPPYPSESGLWKKPTLVNNVETYALTPWIFTHGHEVFTGLGTADSKGTKTFALAGKVANGGLIEVEMGITLREIVETIGGGVPNGKRLKAVQVGGPSGGCVPEHLMDTPVDYETLISTGSMMGSGGMVVLDEDDCMVDIARYFMAFTQMESCGKCTFCRIGTQRMLEILEGLCQGRGRAQDIDELKYLAEGVQRGSLCGLGRTAPNPVLSTIRHFYDEYLAHINGRCPAGKCKNLIRYEITEACIGCTRCAQRCPAEAISFAPYQRHAIDLEKCEKCDLCRQACPVGAVKII